MTHVAELLFGIRARLLRRAHLSLHRLESIRRNRNLSLELGANRLDLLHGLDVGLVRSLGSLLLGSLELGLGLLQFLLHGEEVLLGGLLPIFAVLAPRLELGLGLLGTLELALVLGAELVSLLHHRLADSLRGGFGVHEFSPERGCLAERLLEISLGPRELLVRGSLVLLQRLRLELVRLLELLSVVGPRRVEIFLNRLQLLGGGALRSLELGQQVRSRALELFGGGFVGRLQHLLGRLLRRLDLGPGGGELSVRRLQLLGGGLLDRLQLSLERLLDRLQLSPGGALRGFEFLRGGGVGRLHLGLPPGLDLGDGRVSLRLGLRLDLLREEFLLLDNRRERLSRLLHLARLLSLPHHELRLELFHLERRPLVHLRLQFGRLLLELVPLLRRRRVFFDHRRELFLGILEPLRQLLLVIREELLPGLGDLRQGESPGGEDDGEERGARRSRGEPDLPRGRLPDDESRELLARHRLRRGLDLLHDLHLLDVDDG